MSEITRANRTLELLTLVLITSVASAPGCQSACMPADSQATYVANFIKEIISTPMRRLPLPGRIVS
jgi:hypothetical protein